MQPTLVLSIYRAGRDENYAFQSTVGPNYPETTDFHFSGEIWLPQGPSNLRPLALDDIGRSHICDH